MSNRKLKYTAVQASTLEALVSTLNDDKYEYRNWVTERVSYENLVSGIYRHLNSYRNGEDYDKESGKLHLAHIMGRCVMLIESGEAGTLYYDAE